MSFRTISPSIPSCSLFVCMWLFTELRSGLACYYTEIFGISSSGLLISSYWVITNTLFRHLCFSSSFQSIILPFHTLNISFACVPQSNPVTLRNLNTNSQTSINQEIDTILNLANIWPSSLILIITEPLSTCFNFQWDIECWNILNARSLVGFVEKDNASPLSQHMR